MRLAFISDIHEDVESLRRILRKAEKRGYDQLICLGDISGFSLPFYTYGKKEMLPPRCN
jgi:Icc-related predicted phosphoesterase